MTAFPPSFFSVDINLILFKLSLPVMIYRFSFFPWTTIFFSFLRLVSLFHGRYFPRSLVILSCLYYNLRSEHEKQNERSVAVCLPTVLCCLSQWDVLWESVPNSLRHLLMKWINVSPLNLEYIQVIWLRRIQKIITQLLCSVV